MNNGKRSRSNDFGINSGLLLLRVGVGLTLCIFFGWPKLKAAAAYFHTGQWEFIDFNRKCGLPAPVVAAYVQSLNESVVALFVAIGLFTRYCAGLLFIGFAVATYCSLKVGEPAWLMAGYFALTFATLALTGPCKFSIDFFFRSRAAAKALDSPKS